MSLTMAQVFQEASHFTSATNCYFHNADLCCMVAGQTRLMFWEARKSSSGVSNFDQTKTRIFASDDDGSTWTLLTEFAPPLEVSFGPLYSPGGTRLLIGQNDNNTGSYNSTYSFIARSEDAGTTWTSAITQALHDSMTLQSRVLDFARLPGTNTVLAFGQMEFSGVAYQVMRSLDAGVGFTPFADTGAVFTLDSPLALSATEVLAIGNSVEPYYSTDGGATWTAATVLSSGFNVISVLVSLGGDNVLGLGRNPSGFGRAFLSTDRGHTFDTLTDVGSDSSTFTTGRALTSNIIVGGGREASTNLNSWWVSEDGGNTWAAGTLTGTRVTLSATTALTVTRTGILLADMDRPAGPTNGTNTFLEVWRGSVAGFVGPFGTCESEEFPQPGPEPVVATMGTLFDCAPIFSPPPCPPLCPVDPTQPAGLFFSPVAPFGMAFRSALFLLGLVDGAGPHVVVGAALGVPAGCGHTFANNNCAVAGC